VPEWVTVLGRVNHLAAERVTHADQLSLGYPSVGELALIRAAEPNRSTSIAFVHVNSRSLYIVDRRVVVVEAREMSYTV